jgi:hypothetical protein
MKNTSIATTTKGTILVKFNGSNYSSPCSFIIENDKVTSTYSDKRAGELKEGDLLALRVRKAVSQKYDNKVACTVDYKEFSSPMEILKSITGIFYNGSLSDNSRNI